jgi:hypothetical protein
MSGPVAMVGQNAVISEFNYDIRPDKVVFLRCRKLARFLIPVIKRKIGYQCRHQPEVGQVLNKVVPTQELPLSWQWQEINDLLINK